MTMQGNPVPTTTHQQARAKVADGKAVRVSVPPASGAITAGNFYYYGGFLGVAMQSLDNHGSLAQDLILQIEIAEYETNQINEGQDFTVGTRVYWENDESRFTETPTPIFGGVVTVAKDSNDVIWFLMTPGFLSDAALDAIGDLLTLDTSETGSIVGAINELVAAIGDLGDLDTTADADLVVAINEVVAAIGDLQTLDTSETGSIVGAINEVVAAIGTMGTLDTTEKGNLVGAINEIYADLGTLDVAVGDPATMATTEKAVVVDAISELHGEVDGHGTLLVTIGDAIGDVGDLETTAATVAGAINETYEGSYRLMRFSFDPGGTTEFRDQGAHALGVVLPTGAIVVDGVLRVLTAPTSETGAATIAFHFESAGDVMAADSVDGEPYVSTGLKDVVPANAAANMVLTSEQRTLVATVAEEDLLGGNIAGYLRVILPTD